MRRIWMETEREPGKGWIEAGDQIGQRAGTEIYRGWRLKQTVNWDWNILARWEKIG